MNEVVETVGGAKALPFIRAGVLLVVGFILAKVVARTIPKYLGKRLQPNQTSLLKLIVFYLIFILFVAASLREMGFSLATLLGAAGVFSIAIGFAARTSISNFISGLIIMTEHPFQIGDTIKVGNTTGEVLSIDHLSIKLKTPDNQLVRVPNENILKMVVITSTRYAIRRIQFAFSVSYKEDLRKIRKVLDELAHDHPMVLIEPEPLFTFKLFGKHSIDLEYAVWCKRQNIAKVKNEFNILVKETFEKEGIQFSGQQRFLVLETDKEEEANT